MNNLLNILRSDIITNFKFYYQYVTYFIHNLSMQSNNLMNIHKNFILGYLLLSPLLLKWVYAGQYARNRLRFCN